MTSSFSKTLRAVFLGVALLAVMFGCVGYLLLTELRRTADASPTPVVFVVAPGDSTGAIATKLADSKLIRFPLLFSALVRSRNLDGSLKAGTYNLTHSMTMSQIISALQVSPKFAEVSLTIIEGMRREQIAELVDTAGFDAIDAETFLAATADGSRFKAKHFLLGNLPEGASLEGYLFPDTYRFSKNASVDEVVNTLLDTFDTKYATFETSVQVQRNVHELVTMASIIQREATRVDEMPKISAVYWNRLKPEFAGETGNGKLQADPTLQYALGKAGDWWPNLSKLSLDEINGNSNPYNTRVQPGLPPGPISAPGLTALEAAAKPDQSQPVLYFVAACNDPGAHKFATSFAEFQQFEQEYLACKP